jgi:transglutaminase-like putative cysteine protease
MKKLTAILLAAAVALSLAGCDRLGKSAETTAPGAETSPSGTEQIKPYVYTFDPYALSGEYEKLYGKEFVEMYRDFVDAYLNFETTFECESEQMFEALYSAITENMPYFSSDAYLTFDCYDEAAKTGTIAYTAASADEHKKNIDAFTGEVTDILMGCLQDGDNDLEKSLALYQAFSSSVLYVNDLPGNRINPYYAIMSKQGVSQSIAAAYVYLLRQAGVTAETCSGLTQDLSAAHEWCLIEIDGKYYYADPTYENGDTGGLGLSYFGMTQAERQEAGSFNPENYTLGTTGQAVGSAFDVTDTRFASFRGCYYFELRRSERRVAYFITGNDSEQYFTY